MLGPLSAPFPPSFSPFACLFVFDCGELEREGLDSRLSRQDDNPELLNKVNNVSGT